MYVWKAVLQWSFLRIQRKGGSLRALNCRAMHCCKGLFSQFSCVMLSSHVLLLSAEWGYERLNPVPLQFTLWLWAGIVAGDARIEQVLSPSHLWVLNPLSNPSEFRILWILWISGLPGTRFFLQICFMDICGPFRYNHYDPCIFQLHTLWLFLQSAVELPASSISKACAYKILKIIF